MDKNTNYKFSFRRMDSLTTSAKVSPHKRTSNSAVVFILTHIHVCSESLALSLSGSHYSLVTWAIKKPCPGIFNSKASPQRRIISVCIQIPEPLQYKIIRTMLVLLSR